MDPSTGLDAMRTRPGRIPTLAACPRVASPRARTTTPGAGVEIELAVVRLRDPAVQEVHLADEVGHERRHRPIVDRGRGVQLLDDAVGHHRDAIGHRERLPLVVGDVDERDPDLLLDAGELDLHLLAELEVERAQRLVQEQHPWSVDQCAGQRDPLLLAADSIDGRCLSRPVSWTSSSASRACA
jgi:hypothetical protein